MNEKASSGKITRHFDIKFSYFTDLIKRRKLQVKCYSTNEMDANYMTKPFVGLKFTKFRNCRMIYMVVQQECVGLHIKIFKKI
jgi:hypothetical protein